LTDREPEQQIDEQYETPRITDHGTLTEFTAGMHTGHHLDATFNNHDGPDPHVSVPL
jgi:hypothetical protein